MIPKVVGGIDDISLRVASSLYGAVIESIVPVSSTEIAESAKLLENIFRGANIALVNEMKIVFERTGIDVWQVKSINGAKILVLGLSYKADIDDDRESPSFELIELLRERGADVSYCDPYVPVARKGRKHDLGLASVPCSAEEFARYDAVIDTRNIVPSSLGVRVVRA
jgi:UDP-N-acetyl-D-mannosaminuronate dehydrogenase